MRRRLMLGSFVLVLSALSAAPLFAGVDPLDRRVEAELGGGVSVAEAYRRLGDQAGIRFVFDGSVRQDERVELDVSGLSVRQALQVLDLQVHLARETVTGGVQVVYPDNEHGRRTYQRVATRTFFLQHASVKDINALLRGVVNVRRTAVNEANRSITISDTEAQLALAADVIAEHDVAPSRVELTAELWLVGPKRAKELRGAAGESRILPAGRIDDLRRRSGVDVVASPHAFGSDGESLLVSLGDLPQLFLRLEARPEVHAADREIDLDLELLLRVGAAGSDGQVERRLESSVRLGDGEGLVLGGWLEVEDDGDDALGIMSDEPGERAARELVLILTPRVLRWPAGPMGA